MALAAAACGGSGSDSEQAADAAGVPEPQESSTTTTEAPTTTTAPSTTTTTEPAFDPTAPVAPLTGLPADDTFDFDRPALAIKIDNHQLARPQAQLDQADLVFDLRAEGVTRFMAVFHTNAPDGIGPVRSSRTSDFDLLRGLDYPLYGSSGGNDNVMVALRQVPAAAVTNFSRREYYRNSSRPAPHNLFVDAAALLALQTENNQAPQPWFAYRIPGEPPPPPAVAWPEPVTVAFRGGPTVGFTWDAAREGWLRTQDGAPHVTAAGEQLAPENVVIMETTYGVSPADSSSPEVRSVGEGRVVVLTDGHVVTGRWSRAQATDKPVLVDETGAPIALTRGRTWVLYPEAGQTNV